MIKEKNNYNGSSISHLKGLEGIREKFDMYVGSKEGASFHLLNEVLDNSVDEFMNGYSTKIDVYYDIKKNYIKVVDDGRGLPTDMHPTEGKYTIDLLLSDLHTSGKFNKESFKISAGKNGIGIKAVNALSSKLKVSSIRESKKYYMKFSKGKTISKKLMTEKNDTGLKHGTVFEFYPDEEILDEFISINPKLILDNLELRTYCNAGLKINCIIIPVTGNKIKKTFYNKDGITGYLNTLKEGQSFSDNLEFIYKDKGNRYEVSLAYVDSSDETIISFVNGIKTSGGTHETGFKTGLTKSINTYIKNNELLNKNNKNLVIKGEDIRSGLVCVINLFLTNAQYKGQVKDTLSNPEVQGYMSTITNKEVSNFLDGNKAQSKNICGRIIAFSKGRDTANKYKDKIVNLSKNSMGLHFSNKFTDAVLQDPNLTELIICEGDSAEGNIKYSRDSNIQAIMPLRGKCKNSYSSSTIKLLNNNEFKELIKIIFGTTDVKHINYDEDIRYHKILIACDADPDGKHIENLLLLFFWKHFPELINKGYVYLCLPPKYRTSIKGKFTYFKDDKELSKYLNSQIKKRIQIKDKKYSLLELLKYKNEYLELIDKLFLDHSITESVFNKIIKQEELSDNLIIKNDDEVTGIEDGKWNNFSVESLFNDYDKLFPSKISDINIINIVYDKKELSVSLLELYRLINKISHINLDYFKGLGEASAEELFETTLNPETRDLIQVKPQDCEETEEILKKLYSSDTKDRKLLIDLN